MNQDFKQKYFKYKNKYLNLKNQTGGSKLESVNLVLPMANPINYNINYSQRN